ncbi:MAG: hypothetical protein IJF10_01045 [Clostridia bacterium]|nr:hypothetical protein [Clostridia bacterium]
MSKTFVSLSAMTGWQSNVLPNGFVLQFERLDFAQKQGSLVQRELFALLIQGL